MYTKLASKHIMLWITAMDMFQYFVEEAALLRIMQKIFDISLYEIGGYHQIMKHMKK